MVEKLTRKMFDYQVLCLGLAAVIFVIYTGNIVFEIPLKSLTCSDRSILYVTQEGTEARFRTNLNAEKLHSVQEESGRVDDEKSLPVAPVNLTEDERITWLQKQMPKFEIFKSNNYTRQFHRRVLEFFSVDCEAKFFMTWISPAGTFGPREFLAMESLFKAHPHGCLMILSRSMDSGRGYRILQPLRERGFKVTAVSPDLASLFKDTPAKAWLDRIKSGKKDPGEIPLAQNLSNLMRLAVLYKYGGVYLDTDFITLKPFTELRNTIGAQSMETGSKKWTRLNNAVLVFEVNHPLLLRFMEEFASTFDGNKWGHNGPYMVTRVVERVGNEPGYNFTVLPSMAFYPVNWHKIHGFFQKPKTQIDSRWVEAVLLRLKREAYGVHLWNKQTSRLKIEEGSIMGRLVSKHCVICKQIYRY